MSEIVSRREKTGEEELTVKINGIGLNNVNPYNQTKRPQQTNKAGQSFADKLEISSAAKEMKVASEYTEARAERVQQLKAEIESGEYKVNARKVAEDMLKYYRY